jgi:hypothetical protein
MFSGTGNPQLLPPLARLGLLAIATPIAISNTNRLVCNTVLHFGTDAVSPACGWPADEEI